MVRLDLLLFGYRYVEAAEENIAKTANILLRLGIPTRLFADGKFIIRERDFSRFISAAKGVVISYSDVCGLPGIIKKHRKRYASLVAILLVLFVYILTSNMVWEVRISGNSSL